jgi:hypothetical protein
MNRVVIDNTSAAKLDAVGQQSVEVCDETGRLLGYFTPVIDHSIYEGVESPISSEEMAELIKKGGGRPLKDIIADLQRSA